MTAEQQTVPATPHVARWRAIVLLILGAVACGGTAAPAPERPAPVPAASTHLTMTRDQVEHGGVSWTAVEAWRMSDTVAVTGQLAPNDDRTVRLSAPARARVAALHVRLGDRVQANDPLITLVSEQAVIARAEVSKAQAELSAHQAAARYARTALERAERLLELKAMSRQDVERARVDLEQAESMRTQSQADVERARAALAQLGTTDATGAIVLSAPFAGLVLTRDVALGSVVEAGTPLMTVTEPGTLWLEIAATERVAPLLKRGVDVRFTVPELLPDTFTAVIQNVGAALDPLTRTLPVRAVVANPGERLRPAMMATVVLSVGEARDGVAVPDQAIQLLDERPVAFIATPGADGGAVFERRDVEVGTRVGTRVHVVRGLAPGDVVVTGGAFAVKSQFARATAPVE